MSGPRRGLVAASHPLAGEAGAEILREGGNAVDAAAAVQLALNVVEPLASGIGGGAFALIHLSGGNTFVLDSRERAPAAATADLFLDQAGSPIAEDDRVASGNAVGVPGALMGLAVALKRWGTLPLGRVIEPAIALAEGGIVVSQLLAERLQQNLSKLAQEPASATVFLPGGRPLAEGANLTQPDLGRALRLIAAQGPDAFYRGEIGRALVAAVRRRDGRMTLDDLASYWVEAREPLYGNFRGMLLATMPPPGAGVALLQMLGLIEPFDLASLGKGTTGRVHLELQVMRLALLDRAAYLGDPYFGTEPIPIEGLLDSGYLGERRGLITDDHLVSAPRAGQPPEASGSRDDIEQAAEMGQTTHFVVVDGWGNLVCCTATLEAFFGCGITVPGWGFLLNNQMTDFDAAAGGPNQVRPFARPASSMAPTLLFRDGRPWLALGSPGGPTIISAVFQTLVGVLDDGLSLQGAIDAPRYFAGRFPRFTWEAELPSETRDGLAALGHQPAQSPRTIGSVQAAIRDFDSERWQGAADRRRDGAVVLE